MHYPAKLNDDIVQKWLDTHYNLENISLTFIPQGECSWGYLVKRGDNPRFFLKLVKEGVCVEFPTREAIQAQMTLYHDHAFQQMQPPPKRATTGNYLNPLERFTAQLLPYVKGEPLSAPTEAQQREIGLMIARLHRCKVSLKERPPQENFGAIILDSLKDILKKVYEPFGFFTPLQSKCLAELRHVRHTLGEKLTYLEKERARLLASADDEQDLERDYVVCHGDLRPVNFLTDGGDLILIDWDSMVFAPRERDLHLLKRYPKALEAYQTRMDAMNVNASPDATLITFYEALSQMETITNYTRRILSDEQTDEYNQPDYDQLQAYLKEHFS